MQAKRLQRVYRRSQPRQDAPRSKDGSWRRTDHDGHIMAVPNHISLAFTYADV